LQPPEEIAPSGGKWLKKTGRQGIIIVKIKQGVLRMNGKAFLGAAAVLAAVISLPSSAAVLSLHTNQPSVGACDIASLVGAAADRDNVGTATADGYGNDQTTYIAFDRPAQGQTFVTPSGFPKYRLRAVTVRHAGYTANTSITWYRMDAGSRLTIRITNPALAGTAGFVLASEGYVLTGTEPNIFSPNTITNTANGTGTWVTLTLDAPAELTPNTLYGFDIGSDSAFFETLGIKESVSNPYPAGWAYISGASGAGSNACTAAAGDRVFIVHLDGVIPDGGDLTGNGRVDLEDVALLSGGWQHLYGLTALAQIAAHWLFTEPPVFKSDPILAADAQAGAAYSASLTDAVIYYNPLRLVFAKISGPAWLTVSPEGRLSGCPSAADVGLASAVVQADDGMHPPVQATVQIAVVQQPLQAVPFTQVTFADAFWQPRLQTNRQVTIPYIFSKLQETGRIDNFAIAGKLMTGTPRYDFPFDDTDIYKTLEGASYSLMVTPDPALEAYLDELIVKIAAAQEHNGYLPGYLYTIRTNGVDIWCGPAPWTNLSMSHELYNAGHLFEAAIAHYQATGKTALLNVAKQFADLLVDTFHDGGVEIPPGHEIVESALARLSDTAADKRYLDLARYYLDIRGTVTDDYSPWGQYYQDHLPVLQQTEAVGHVVRAVYLYMGMADVAARTADGTYRKALMQALDAIWHSVNDTKAYITGGLGASHGGESFGAPYYLPNDGYCETCAQIANVMWNHRMFLYHRDGKYIDVLERTLYNALISGVSLKGDTFFYPNPLVSSGGYTRSAWFSCNCCIGNIARTIPSIPGYVYARADDAIYINLYAAGTGQVQLDQTAVRLTQTGNYPWDGTMTITVQPDVPADFTIYVRIPGWAQNQPVPGDLYAYRDAQPLTPSLDVNGTPVALAVQKGYVAVSRTWQAGDQIHLSLPMAVRQVQAHPNIAADAGRIALERGPIVYCAEWPDFEGRTITHLYIPDGADFSVEYRDNMLGIPELPNAGAVIKGTVKGLYEAAGGAVEQRDVPFTAIPYYAWAHRGPGQMAVWLPAGPDKAVPIPQPTPAELVGHWKLDETAGTTAADSSGKQMNGTLLNGLSFSSNAVAGPVGNALSFDGSNDYIDLPDGFSDFAKGCTITLWARPTAVKNWARFVDLGNGSAADNIWFGRQGTTGNLAFECWAGSSSSGLVTAAGAIALNEWQMFAVTADSFGHVKLFKNGQLIQTGSSAPSSVTRTRNFIGRSNWSADAYYQGALDDIRIYNYNLSDDAVMQLYTGL